MFVTDMADKNNHRTLTDTLLKSVDIKEIKSIDELKSSQEIYDLIKKSKRHGNGTEQDINAAVRKFKAYLGHRNTYGYWKAFHGW